MQAVVPGIRRPRPTSRPRGRRRARALGRAGPAPQRVRSRREGAGALGRAHSRRGAAPPPADAADAAWLAGQPDQALELLDRAAAGVSRPRLRADVAHLAVRSNCVVAYRPMRSPSWPPARPRSRRSIPSRRWSRRAAAGEGGILCQGCRPDDRGGAPGGQHPRGEQRVDHALGLLVGIGGIPGAIPPRAPLLREAIMLAQTFDDPSRLGFAGAAARYLGDGAGHPRLLSPGGRACPRHGWLVPSPSPGSLAVAEVAAGRYTAATASASERAAPGGRPSRRAASAGTSAPSRCSAACRAARTPADRTPPRLWSTRFRVAAAPGSQCLLGARPA